MRRNFSQGVSPVTEHVPTLPTGMVAPRASSEMGSSSMQQTISNRSASGEALLSLEAIESPENRHLTRAVNRSEGRMDARHRYYGRGAAVGGSGSLPAYGVSPDGNVGSGYMPDGGPENDHHSAGLNGTAGPHGHSSSADGEAVNGNSADNEREESEYSNEDPAFMTDAMRAQRLAFQSMGRQWYPHYHCASPGGWLSVPGGVVQHKGVYHVFSQHHPYSVNWGLMHWAHFTSTDLISWQMQPIALTPYVEGAEGFADGSGSGSFGTPSVAQNGWGEDRDGCFSGSAISHGDKLYVFYTGHTWRMVSSDGVAAPGGHDRQSNNIMPPNNTASGQAGGDGEGEMWGDAPRAEMHQQQCLAVSTDGIHFEKRGAIIKPPKGYIHFRDPKVWREGNVWCLVCGARSPGLDCGVLLLYTSDSLEEWDDTQFTVVAQSEDRNVFMWECPDLFPLFDSRGSAGSMHALVYCPQGMAGRDFRYRNRFQCGYSLGSLVAQRTPASGTRSRGGSEVQLRYVERRPFVELDHGHDFYSAQTFLSEDGRRILIAWLDMWESPMPSKEDGWSGVITLPRELVYSEQLDRLLVRPVRELKGLRLASAAIPPQTLQANAELRVVEDCIAFELELTFNIQRSSAERYGFWLGSGCDVCIDAQSERIMLHRHYPDFFLSGYRSFPLPREAATVSLRVFIDSSSIEVFVDDGVACLSSRVYPKMDDRCLRLYAINGEAVLVSGTVYELGSSITRADGIP